MMNDLMLKPETKPYIYTAIASFLCLALFAYPFSVAGSSLFLGLLALTSFIRFEVIKKGFQILWLEYHLLSLGVLSMVLITALGYFWSEDVSIAAHQVKKQVNWLILPVVLGAVFFISGLRKKAFLALSLGLFVHLIVCTLQYYGVLTIKGQGSGQLDATGFLGHLSFGFVYAIWAGSLIVAAQDMCLRWRLVCYVLALYAVVTIFLAQGRSGYILAVVMLILIVWKVLFQDRQKLKLMTLLIILAAVTSFFVMHEPSQAKVKTTWSGVEAYLEKDWAHVDERFKIWTTGVEVWKKNPWLGVGSGDYKQAAAELLEKPEFKYLIPSSVSGLKIDQTFHHPTEFHHPHNEFLYALSRWGPVGLAIVVFLCWTWLQTGWKKDWQHDTMNAYLCTSSALAVIIHGMTEVSLNSKLTFTFAIIVLAFSLSKEREPSSK